MNPQICLLVSKVKWISDFKYLEIFHSEDMKHFKDVDQFVGAFLKQLHGVHRKFSYTDIESFTFLFKTYSSSKLGWTPEE